MSTALDSRPSKRGRSADYEFSAVIHFPQSLRSVVSSVLDVDREMMIQVCDGTQRAHKGFTGLVIEAMDARHVCMVIAYIAASVEIQPDTDPVRLQLLITTQTVNTCLKSTTPTQTLTLGRLAGEVDLQMAMSEVDPNRASTVYSLKTLNRTSDALNLEAMKFDYLVEFEMGAFRPVIKAARELHAEAVRLRVLDGGDNGPASFVMSFQGDADAEHVFDTVSRLPDGQIVDSLVGGFDESYASEYLHTFLKCLENKSTVSIRLAQGLPLIMSYTLGDTGCSMNFVLDRHARS
jgi:hypothetical protein